VTTIVIEEQPSATVEIGGEGDEPTVEVAVVVTLAQGEGSGDVVGPSSSVSGHLAVFSGTTGKAIASGGTTVVALESAIAAKADASALTAHVDDATAAHAATAISVVPSDGFTAEDAQGALEEIGSLASTLFTATAAHVANTSNPHVVTAAQVGAIPYPADPSEGDVATYSGGEWVAAAPSGGGLPKVSAVRGFTAADYYTIPDIFSGATDWTWRMLLRGANDGTQLLVSSDNFALDLFLEGGDNHIFRGTMRRGFGAGNATKSVYGAWQPGRLTLITISRRSLAGDLVWSIGVDGSRWIAAVGSGVGAAPDESAVPITICSSALSPASKMSLVGFGANVGAYAAPEEDLAIVEAAMETGGLGQVGSAFTHLWQVGAAEPGPTWAPSVGAVSATRVGGPLTRVELSPRW
jgi:hypothetical protein